MTPDVDASDRDIFFYRVSGATFKGYYSEPNGITLTIVMQDRGSGLKGTKCSVKMDGNVIDPGNCVVKGGGTVKKDRLNGETRSCTFTVVCKTEGVHRYEAVATDVAGNQNAASSAVYYDITAPTGHVDVTGPGIDSGANLNSLNSSTGWTFKEGRVTDYH